MIGALRVKIFVLSIFEWPFYTGFTVVCIDTEKKHDHSKLLELRPKNKNCFSLTPSDRFIRTIAWDSEKSVIYLQCFP